MKYLKLFESYKESDIAKICKKYGIENWSINSDGLVDVDGKVFLFDRGLTKLPLSFGYVSGNFSCGENKLTNLAGCPKSVGKGFYCYGNELTSLEGCPQEVVGDFFCWNNKLTSLEGCPREVGGNFRCQINRLKSLQGGPHTVTGDFYCHDNQLTSLRFAPEEVWGEVAILPNPISDIPKKYLNEKYLEFIVKEQPDWRLYDKNGYMRLDRLEEMIEWGIETNKIKPL
jgi:hypothetical protein